MSSLSEASSDSIAIFDTSALIRRPEILEITMRNDIVVVIPYTVLQELDGLNKSRAPSLRNKVALVQRELDRLSVKNNLLLRLESGIEVNEQMDGFIVEDNDDKIIKCALRTEKSMVDRMTRISFVTNDINQRLKTRGFKTTLTVIGSEEFLSELEIDDDEGDASTPPFSPQKSPTSSLNSNEKLTISALPLKRKALSFVDDNVSSPASKRSRFEEHCDEHEYSDKQVRIENELKISDFRWLRALESMRPSRGSNSFIFEAMRRRSVIRSLKGRLDNLLQDRISERLG